MHCYADEDLSLLIVASIHLKDFRNIRDCDIEFSPGLNVFYGKNGQGKTNFLEAIYYACRGKSFRKVHYNQLIRHNQQSATIEGRLRKKNQQYRFFHHIEEDQKTCLVGNKKIGPATLLQNFPNVLFSPETVGIVKDEPEGRRNFIDEVVFSENAAEYPVFQISNSESGT